MTSLCASGLRIQELKNRYQLDTIVETGCWHGHGLEFSQQIGIQNLYSCDINQTYVDECTKKFPQAVIRHQDSISFLKEVLPSVNGKTLFWLDAHYPVYYGLEEENSSTKFPLVEELLLVKSLKKNFQQDVIVCDDLRVLLPDNNPYYNPGVGDQFMVNIRVQDLIDVFSSTHDYYLVSEDTGNLIFIPKN